MKNDKKTKNRNLSKEDLERIEILQQVDEIKGEQLLIDLNSEFIVENLAESLLAQEFDDPQKKYQLYYQGLSNLLKEHLPKGKDNEEIRRIVYDEKNILLNRGAKKNSKGIRGSDSRMAYIEDLEIAIQIVADWVSDKGSALDLYMAFWDKNEDMNYGHQD